MRIRRRTSGNIEENDDGRKNIMREDHLEGNEETIKQRGMRPMRSLSMNNGPSKDHKIADAEQDPNINSKIEHLAHA